MTVVAAIAYATLGAAVYCAVVLLRRRIVTGAPLTSRPELRKAAIFLAADAVIVAAAFILIRLIPDTQAAGFAFRLGPEERIYLAIAAGVTALVALLSRVLGARKNDGRREDAEEVSGPRSATGRIGALAIIVVGVFAEELLFRGYVRALLPQSPTVFLTVSTVLFALSRLLPATAINDFPSEDIRSNLRRFTAAAFQGPALALVYALSGSLAGTMLLRLLFELADRYIVMQGSEAMESRLRPVGQTIRQTIFLIVAAVLTVPLTGYWYLFR